LQVFRERIYKLPLLKKLKSKNLSQVEKLIWIHHPYPKFSLTERHKQVIDITPRPHFTWLGRANHRVTGTVEMPGSVLVWRGIAAEGNAAGLAGAQVYPGSTDCDAFLALIRFRYLQFLALGKMNTGSGFHRIIV
jgi:hypothetical protein